MARRRGLIVVAGLTAVAALALGVGAALWLDGALNAGNCASLRVALTEKPAAVRLDEAEVRREAPRLAALLDEAAAEGAAGRTGSEAHEMANALNAQTGDYADPFAWRGANYSAMLSVC